MSVITYGSAVHLALDAAEELGEDIEVIDLRSLCPLDTDAILASARKTGKVLVAHEATQSCGVGAEVAALVAAEAFEDLDAPVRRLPLPTSRSRSAPAGAGGSPAARRHEGGLP